MKQEEKAKQVIVKALETYEASTIEEKKAIKRLTGLGLDEWLLLRRVIINRYQ